VALPFLAALTLGLFAFGHPCDAAVPVPAPAEPAAVEAPATVPAPVRIAVNRAAPEELERLPGIGPRKAAALVEARGLRPFKRPSDLRRVKGFGARTVQRLAPLMTFD